MTSAEERLNRLLGRIVVSFRDVHSKPCIKCLLCDPRGTWVPLFAHAVGCPAAPEQTSLSKPTNGGEG